METRSPAREPQREREPERGRVSTRDLASDGSAADLAALSRLAGVGELLAEVVHELRNGLVSIKTFVQLLPEHRDDPEFETRFRDVTDEEFARIERLLGAVLDQASGTRRRGAAAHTSADPEAAVAGVATLLKLRADKLGVALHTECSSDGFLGMDEDALRQVLLNLVLNAFSVSERGDTVRVVSERRGALFEIRVEDEGPGVPRDQRDRIFEPFFTSRSESAGGLGLAISRRLVEAAGGTLTVRDRPGGGSAFRVRLPLWEEPRRETVGA